MITSIPLLVTGCIIPYFPLGCNFFFCGVYFDAAAHVLMGEGGDGYGEAGADLG